SRPTSVNSPERRRSSYPPESSPCSMSRRRSRCWRRSACRCWGSVRVRCRSSIPRRAGPSSVRAWRQRRKRRRAHVTTGSSAGGGGAHWGLGGGGVVLAQPPPTSLDDVEPLIQEALAEADRQGVRGQAVTPFVLAFLHERSGGRTLAVNRELIAANAGLAARV